MVSLRVSKVSKSETVSLSNHIQELKKQGIKVFNFGIGEPDFTTPLSIIEYAFQKAREGATHYTPSKGIPELRKKIAEYFSKRYSNIMNENVLVTSTKFSINLSIMSICDPGDEILIPEPYYLSYPEICRIFDVKPITFRSNDDYSINFDLMEKLIGPKTRAILIANPSNPTGKVLSKSDIEKIIKICREKNMYFICDQIYEDLVYEGELTSPVLFDPYLKNTIILSGFSKSFAMTGWRIGYMIASKEIIDASDIFQQQTVTCAPSVSQEAALYALDHHEESEKMREEFKTRREIAIRELSKIKGLSIIKPDGAFYLFPSYDLKINSKELCLKILEEKKVSLIPGSVFGEQGEYHFRLSYASSELELIEGISKLAEYFNNAK
ncbi:MAG: pyridoxal phosphate-dependent aminotransferase [Thermoplasmataceae archaeon]